MAADARILAISSSTGIVLVELVVILVSRLSLCQADWVIAGTGCDLDGKETSVIEAGVKIADCFIACRIVIYS